MRIVTLCLVLFTVCSLAATTTFTDINAAMTGVFTSSSRWGDYDNDGYLDLIITGTTASTCLTKIYHNNGNGTFTDINAGLPGIRYGSAVWGDYDNDGYLDFAMSGDDNTETFSTRIYHNNHNGTFTDINAGLPGVIWGSLAWAITTTTGAWIY